MANTNINIRIDAETKNQAQELFSSLGMDLTTAINIFIKKSIATGGIPFAVSHEPFYSARNIEALKESKKQLESGKVILKSLEELEDMTNE